MHFRRLGLTQATSALETHSGAVAKLADARDLGSRLARGAGSIPVSPIRFSPSASTALFFKPGYRPLFSRSLSNALQKKTGRRQGTTASFPTEISEKHPPFFTRGKRCGGELWIVRQLDFARNLKRFQTNQKFLSSSARAAHPYNWQAPPRFPRVFQASCVPALLAFSFSGGIISTAQTLSSPRFI